MMKISLLENIGRRAGLGCKRAKRKPNRSIIIVILSSTAMIDNHFNLFSVFFKRKKKLIYLFIVDMNRN